MENQQEISPAVIKGMDAESIFQIVSDNEVRYRIFWKCGSAEASRRQRVAGRGDVVNGGYVRETSSDYLADMAAADESAEVEEI